MIGVIQMLYLTEADFQFSAELESFKSEILLYDAGNEDQFAGCMGLRDAPSAEDWIRLCNLRKDPATCEQTGTNVPSTTYFAIRESDCRLVGIIDLRHHIDHPILSVWGGHTGYSVRPSERGRGYAKEMLRLNLQNAEAMGIPRILVTCSEKNLASEKTILANGGVFERFVEVDGTRIKRYWLDL